MPQELDLVNVVGTGYLERELDIHSIGDNLDNNSVCEISDTGRSLNIKLSEESGTFCLYRSGKYNIMGCRSVGELESTTETLINLISELGIDFNTESGNLRITNYVFTVDLDISINLSNLYVKIGEQARYEPEQNSFLIYNPDGIAAVITISSSGKSVINSPEGREEAIRIKEDILDILSELE